MEKGEDEARGEERSEGVHLNRIGKPLPPLAAIGSIHKPSIGLLTVADTNRDKKREGDKEGRWRASEPSSFQDIIGWFLDFNMRTSTRAKSNSAATLSEERGPSKTMCSAEIERRIVPAKDHIDR